jgi:hypothetical protein
VLYAIKPGSPQEQMVYMHEGTLLHRRCCPVTLPSLGWTPFEKPTEAFLRTMSEQRTQALQTRAVLTIRIPIAEPQIPTHGWNWLSQPPSQEL